MSKSISKLIHWIKAEIEEATDRPLPFEIHATAQNFLPQNLYHWPANFSLKFMLTELLLFLEKWAIRLGLNVWKCVQPDHLFSLEICAGNLYLFLLIICASLPAQNVFGFQRSHVFLVIWLIDFLPLFRYTFDILGHVLLNTHVMNTFIIDEIYK